jgi:hypothetical protein
MGGNNTWEGIINKIREKLNGRTFQFLSLTGRILLIKTILRDIHV